MAKSVLVVEADDHGLFFLSLAGGTLALGESAGRPEFLLRDFRVTSVRCEIEIEDDTILVGRPPGPGGEPAPQQRLHAGQGVRLAHARLRLEALEEEDEPDAPDVPAAPLPEGTFRRLRVIDGADMGRAFRLPDAGSLAVGKNAKQADVVLHDLHVSPLHCHVDLDGGRVFVRHHQGEAGTLVNNKRIGERQELHVNDVLRVGNSHLKLETALTLDAATPTKDDDDEEELTAHDEAGKLEHELLGRDFGPYRLVELLGWGHTSEVFRARDVRNNLTVAVKVLPAAFPADGPELQRFVQALKAATQTHHPNLVTVLTAGRTGGRCWIAREYVEGQSAATVAARLAQRGKISWTRAGRVAVHLARALGFLQEQRLVHGNVSPANVLLGEDKSTRLGDLMLDKALESSRLQIDVLEEKLLVELPYLAPEQTDSKAFIDGLADLYSLGAVLYLLLTGRPPFAGESPAEIIEQIRAAPPARPSTHQRGIPPAFEAIVMKLLAKHQEDRYQTAAELLAAVEALAQAHKLET